MIPTFGIKEEGKTYVPRYAAYAVLVDEEKRIAVVKAPNGAYFLPGGEIEGTETKEEAIVRELLEELGAEVEISDFIGQADEYFYSSHRKTYYHNPGYFYATTSWKIVSAPLEEGNISRFVSAKEALTLLKRGSHQWALKKWLADQK